MCWVGPQTHGPLKPGPFEPSSAQLKGRPGVSLSWAWEFKKPRLRAWPRPGHLFSWFAFPAKFGYVRFATCHVTLFTCLVESRRLVDHFIGPVIDLFLTSFDYLHDNRGIKRIAPYQSHWLRNNILLYNHYRSDTKSILRHSCRISKVFTWLHHLNPKTRSYILQLWYSGTIAMDQLSPCPANHRTGI